MSNGSFMSVLALYRYKDNLFEGMKFPTGFSAEDKANTINNILLECAELDLLYPSWDTMHDVIPIWSAIELPVWTRIYKASQLEYNPIENYNRTEISTITHDLTEQHSGNDINKATGSDSEQASGSDTLTLDMTESHSGKDTTEYDDSKTSENSGHDITENSMTSYDSNSLYLHDKSDLSHGQKVTDTGLGSSEISYGESVDNDGTETTAYGRKNTTTYGKTDTLTHGEKIEHDGTDKTESNISGNIGVTTSQQMLEQELQIAPKLNIIKMITDSFKERFCLLVY